ncbi:MAG: hypothetical protein U0836_05975 [Pirellulales bacterium]
MRRFVVCALLTLVVFSRPHPAWARIKLITLPVRERVEIQLDHANATLVEEERIVPLTQGVNQVDFSWKNTQIDPNSIVFRVLGPAQGGALEAKVLSVSYPPNEAALVWQVAANESGSARVRISYLLGNLNKSFNYRAVATHDESTLVLSQYLRLQNLANEAFGSTGLWAGYGQRFLKPIGLNETKEMLAEKYVGVPIRKTYTASLHEFGYLDPAQQKLRVPMHYVLKNDEAHKLGRAPLEYGKVRIFQEDSRGSATFLGEDWGRFTPLDDEMKLYLGVAQDIVVKRTIEHNEVKRLAGNLFDREVVVKYEIENFKDKPVTLDLAESLRALRNEVHGDTGRDVEWSLGGQTSFPGGLDQEKSTQDLAVLHADLPARDADGKAQKLVHRLHVVIRNEW